VLRLAASHEDLEIVFAAGESNAGKTVASHAPALARVYPTLSFDETEAVFEHELDVVFVALPHGASQKYVPKLLDRNVQVVDLGADFRLKNPDDYAQWYHQDHVAPSLLATSVYGLVERHRKELLGAKLIAVPGCYPTASALALGPFLDDHLVSDQGVIVNALSGVSGAGRAPSERLHFSRLAGNAEAYGLLDHRHTVEIQQELGAQILFTPHLVPTSRGELITAYARVAKDTLDTEGALALLRARYANDPFMVVVDEPPAMKDPLGSNLCFVSARVDTRTGWLVAMSSLDNLIKGAAGQAIQAWNVATGRDEATGLPRSGVTP